MAQEQFDPLTDYIEKDDLGNPVAAWADYYQDKITPTEPEVESSPIYSSITYSGTKPDIKIGGSYKTFTVSFFDHGAPIDYPGGNWTFKIDNVDISDLVTIQEIDGSPNKIKAKFTGGLEYMDNVITVRHTSPSGIISEIKIDVVGL